MVIEAAQRLIDISLGKMASVRSQRGGARLHRELLLNGVLNQARCATFKPQAETSELPKIHEGEDRLPVGQTILIDRTAYLEDVDVSETGIEHLMRNVDADKTKLEDQHTITCLLDCDSRPVVPDTEMTHGMADSSHTSPSKSRRRLCKGVLPDVVPTSDRIHGGLKRKGDSWTYDSLHAKKKSRCEPELDAELDDHVPADIDGDYYMQTDCVQLTSLVNSFTGLLTYIDQSDESFFDDSSLRKLNNVASSSESLMSCSLHIREALETLSRPIIAIN